MPAVVVVVVVVAAVVKANDQTRISNNKAQLLHRGPEILGFLQPSTLAVVGSRVSHVE